MTLQRKRRGDSVERFRKGRLYPNLKDLARRAARWAADHMEVLRAAEPKLPAWFDNRLADNWEPLLGIAEAVSEEWGELAREAAEAIGQAEDEGREILLLRDLRHLFEHVEELTTQDLLDRLHTLEEGPWAHANRGKPVTGHWLGKALRRFGICSVKVLNGGAQRRGYRRAQFSDAWVRYLDPSAIQPSEVSEASQVSHEGASADAWDGMDASSGRNERARAAAR